MKSHELLSRRINEVTDLRDKLKEMLLFHLEALEKEELAAKDRIELIGRLLPFAVNKIVAGKEDKLPKRQSDPLEGIS